MTQNNNNCKHIALIDLGSSALRIDLFSCDIQDPKKVKLINKYRSLPRLGVLNSGKIVMDRLQDVLILLKGFNLKFSEYENISVLAVGTAVFRDASNGKEIIKLLSESLGTEFTILSGTEEARLIRKGIIAFERSLPLPAIFLDIGGRSSEISFCNPSDLLTKMEIDSENQPENKMDTLISMPFGAQSSFEDFFSKTTSDNSDNRDSAFHAFKDHIFGYLETHPLKQGLPEGLPLVGSSGTFKALRYLYEESHGRLEAGKNEIPLSFLFEVLQDITNTSKEQIPKILKDETHRYDLILGGFNLLKICIEYFNISTIFTTPYSARHGLLYEELSKWYDKEHLLELYIEA